MGKIYLPENLNIGELLAKHPPGFSHHPDKFKYICWLISRQKYCTDKEYHWGYVNLSSAYLENVIWDYKPHIQYLIDNNIIETDNQYFPGEVSRGYRFAKPYQTLVKPDEITKYTILKKLRQVKCQSRKTTNRPARSYPFVHWVDTRLTIDIEAADLLNEATFQENIRRKKKHPVEKRNAAYIATHQLYDGDFSYPTLDNYGRIHSILTRLPKIYRHLLSYNGCKLCSVDVGNSQLLTIAAILKPEFYSTTTTGSNLQINNLKINYNHNTIHTIPKTINTYNTTTTYNTHHHPPPHTPIMFLKNEVSLVNPSFQKYFDLVSTATFIQEYGKWYTNTTGKKLPEKRTLKKMIFHALYSHNSSWTKGKEYLKSVFPAVYTVICYLKSDNYKLLPWLMQTIEANIMLDRVAMRISRERPDMPLLTMHDSIVCPIGNEEYVKRVIEEEWLLAIGLNITVKTEYWEEYPESSVKILSWTAVSVNGQCAAQINGIEHSETNRNYAEEVFSPARIVFRCVA